MSDHIGGRIPESYKGAHEIAYKMWKTNQKNCAVGKQVPIRHAPFGNLKDRIQPLKTATSQSPSLSRTSDSQALYAA